MMPECIVLRKSAASECGGYHDVAGAVPGADPVPSAPASAAFAGGFVDRGSHDPPFPSASLPYLSPWIELKSSAQRTTFCSRRSA